MQKTTIINLEVRSFEWRKDAAGAEYTTYTIHVQSKADQWVVSKRFSQFQKLYRVVQSHLPSYVFPTNFTWGRLSDASLETRRVQLQEFLKCLLGVVQNEHEQDLCRTTLEKFVHPEMQKAEPSADEDRNATQKGTKTESDHGSYYSYMQQLVGSSSIPSTVGSQSALSSSSSSACNAAGSSTTTTSSSDASSYFSQMAQYWSPNVGIDLEFWFPAPEPKEIRKTGQDEATQQLDTDEDTDEESYDQIVNKRMRKETQVSHPKKLQASSSNPPPTMFSKQRRAERWQQQLHDDDCETANTTVALQDMGRSWRAQGHLHACLSQLDTHTEQDSSQSEILRSAAVVDQVTWATIESTDRQAANSRQQAQEDEYHFCKEIQEEDEEAESKAEEARLKDDDHENTHQEIEQSQQARVPELIGVAKGCLAEATAATRGAAANDDDLKSMDLSSTGEPELTSTMASSENSADPGNDVVNTNNDSDEDSDIWEEVAEFSEGEYDSDTGAVKRSKSNASGDAKVGPGESQGSDADSAGASEVQPPPAANSTGPGDTTTAQALEVAADLTAAEEKSVAPPAPAPAPAPTPVPVSVPAEPIEYQTEDAEHHPSWPRFLAGCKGNRTVAQERWVKTMTWRRDQKVTDSNLDIIMFAVLKSSLRDYQVDSILDQKQPHFKIIKKYYPHCYHGRSKDGWPVYYERPAGIDLSSLTKCGVSMPDLLRHNMYVTEFQWQRLQGDTEELRQAAKSMTIMDMKGISLKDVGPDKLEFIKAIAAYRGAHYPERAAHIFIVNVPMWFSTVWNLVCPFIDPKTVSKTHIVSAGWSGTGVTTALLKHIDSDQLPREYGGTSEHTFGDDAGTERLLLNHADAVLNDPAADVYR